MGFVDFFYGFLGSTCTYILDIDVETLNPTKSPRKLKRAGHSCPRPSPPPLQSPQAADYAVWGLGEENDKESTGKQGK